MGAERGVYCKHMQALLTNVLQRHWVWVEDRREAWVLGTIWYRTAYVASLHVKTAFDVAKPSAVSHMMTSIDTNGYLVAAFLEEMKGVRGSACIENCET